MPEKSSAAIVTPFYQRLDRLPKTRSRDVYELYTAIIVAIDETLPEKPNNKSSSATTASIPGKTVSAAKNSKENHERLPPQQSIKSQSPNKNQPSYQ
jgi:hypothetical protein